MKLNEKSAVKIAKYLLQIKAIKLNLHQPFTWASGIKSPIYCDNRKALSYPEVRNAIRDEFVDCIRNVFPSVDAVAGVATGAIAHGVLVAQALELPFVYVRSAEKKHGLGNLIEGEIAPESKVVVIEDLVSTGQSSLAAVEALRNNNFNVLGLISIFNYNFDEASEAFSKTQCPEYALSDYNTLLKMALDSGEINNEELQSLNLWRDNPRQWL